MPNQNNQKPYNPALGCIEDFYIPHQEANHLNAQDVVHSLLSQAINTSTVTQNCFNEHGELDISACVVSNLIWELQTKLEMIKKILPLAFQWEAEQENKKAVTL